MISLLHAVVHFLFVLGNATTLDKLIGFSHWVAIKFPFWWFKFDERIFPLPFLWYSYKPHSFQCTSHVFCSSDLLLLDPLVSGRYSFYNFTNKNTLVLSAFQNPIEYIVKWKYPMSEVTTYLMPIIFFFAWGLRVAKYMNLLKGNFEGGSIFPVIGVYPAPSTKKNCQGLLTMSLFIK